MTSVSNHSPGSLPVSSAGFSPPQNAVETDPLAVLVVQAERAAAWLIEVDADPQRQAALRDLALQSQRAADALLTQRQDAGSLPTFGETP